MLYHPRERGTLSQAGTPLPMYSNWQFHFIWNCKGKPIIFRRSLFCAQWLILTSSLLSIRNSYSKFKLDSFELKFSPSFVVLVMMIVNSYSRWRIAWMLLGMSNFSNFSCRFVNNNYFVSNLNYICSNIKYEKSQGTS